MQRVLAFFCLIFLDLSSFCWRGWVGTCTFVYGQTSTPTSGISASAGKGAETSLYKQAVEKFRGPSRVFVLDSDKTGLSVWTSPMARQEYGVVLDWNDDRIVLVRPDSIDAVVQPTTRVVRIEPTWENETAAKLHEQFTQHRYADAIALGSKVLGPKSTAPKWQQRILLAELVESLAEMGRWEKSASLYISLARESPPPLLASVIPLPWMDSTAELKDRKALQGQAVQWLNDPNELIQLMGASWLLDSDARTEAIQRLEQLGKESKQELVGHYAQAQLWRTIPPQELAGGSDRTSPKRERCLALREAMFPPSQAGPTFLLAERLHRGGATELAIQEWLRVMLVHPERNGMARNAGKSAKAQFQLQAKEENVKWIDVELKKLEDTSAVPAIGGGALIPSGSAQ